jgi:hypothetical protein
VLLKSAERVCSSRRWLQGLPAPAVVHIAHANGSSALFRVICRSWLDAHDTGLEELQLKWGAALGACLPAAGSHCRASRAALCTLCAGTGLRMSASWSACWRA